MKQVSANNTAKVIYISHGGGPLPILGDPGHKNMINFMKSLSGKIARPESVIIISAHWEERDFTITGNKKPSLLYDYYGFPAEAYNLQYPLKTSLETVSSAAQLLKKSNINFTIDKSRGFDHGAFIPMMLMYPEGDVPIIQISLAKGLNPEEHIKLGKALSPLMQQNILIIGSGFSFHNMRAFSFERTEDSDPRNDAFQSWLTDVCSGVHTPEKREQLLIHWEKAPHARYCHPREEHLMPLHVCAGITGEPATVIFDDTILGKRSLGFLWDS